MMNPGRLLPVLVLLGLGLGLGLQGCGPSRSSLKANSAGTTASIKDIRMWHAPTRSRIVFDMDRRATFKAFKLAAPDRVVIDLHNAKINSAIPAAATTGQFIRRIRPGTRNKTTTRLVFDIDQPVRYAVQMLKPSGRYQYRLVVDFYHRDAVVEADKPPAVRRPGGPKSELLILLDPGHGGEDPGAVGKRAYEKNVVLQIAKKLQARVNKYPGLRAELTRTGDYYISLRKRTRIARRRGAYLFVSIHADAVKNKSARGASVYTLSERGASSESARWLANKENSSDLLGGVSLADKDDQLAGVLLDLAKSNTANESVSFGRDVLAELKKIGHVHSKRVEKAGFVVLKSPDIPSILVETAYITNPKEEKLLMNSKHQERIAGAVAAGIARYLTKIGHHFAAR